MKKKFLFLMIIFLLTGCSAEYTLIIADNGTYDENLVVTEKTILKNKDFFENSSYTYNDFYNEQINKPLEVYYKDVPNGDYSGTSYNKDAVHYKMTEIKNNEYFGIEYSNSIPKYEYIESTMIKSCFNYSSIYENDNGNNVLITDKSFNCWNDKLDSLIIKIKTKYKVVSTNADEIDGENYIWKFTSSNYKDKSIFIEYTDYYNDSVTNKNRFKSFINSNFLVVFSFIILLIAGILLLIIKKKQDKENKI